MQRPQDRNDPRSRYTHQAYDVSYMGKAAETGPSGYGRRLSGSANYTITFTAAADVAGPTLIGDLTQGLCVFSVTNHLALTSGTATIKLPAFGGEPEVTLAAGVDLTAQAETFVTGDGLVPLSIDRPMTIEMAAGTADETAAISLNVAPIEGGWK